MRGFNQSNPFGITVLEDILHFNREETGDLEASKTTRGVSETALKGSGVRTEPVRQPERAEDLEIGRFVGEGGFDPDKE